MVGHIDSAWVKKGRWDVARLRCDVLVMPARLTLTQQRRDMRRLEDVYMHKKHGYDRTLKA